MCCRVEGLLICESVASHESEPVEAPICGRECAIHVQSCLQSQRAFGGVIRGKFARVRPGLVRMSFDWLSFGRLAWATELCVHDRAVSYRSEL